MNRILVSLHVALVLTLLLPVYRLGFWHWRMGWHDVYLGPGNSPSAAVFYTPLGQAATLGDWENDPRDEHGPFLLVAAAGIPGWLALMNLPLILGRLGTTGSRWRAYSSTVLGLLSTSNLALLISSYGDDVAIGSVVIWILSVLLVIAGTAAVARLQPATAALPVIRDA